MREHLSGILPCPALVDKIVHYIYKGQDINRHTSTQMKSILGSFRWKLLRDFNVNGGPPVRLAFRKNDKEDREKALPLSLTATGLARNHGPNHLSKQPHHQSKSKRTPAPPAQSAAWHSWRFGLG